VQEQPDVPRLLEWLASPHWPVATAAAEVLGRRGCTEAADALLERLQREHAIPTDVLYPPEDARPGEGRSTEDLGKRWRLKAVLIVALGRLKARRAVKLLGQILADGRDFYAVYSAAAQALGRIGGPGALKALQPALKESEVNTNRRARFAVAAVRAAAKRKAAPRRKRKR